MDEMDAAAAKRKRDIGFACDDREVDENDDSAATVEDINEARKLQLYKLGFRLFESESKFLPKSREECELERIQRVERMRRYKEKIDKIDEPIDLPEPRDDSFAKVWGNPLPLAIVDHNNIFNEITTKNNGGYRKQHWHMKEVEMEKESEEVEMEKESEEVAPVEVEMEKESEEVAPVDVEEEVVSVEEDSVEVVEESVKEASTEEQRMVPLLRDNLTFRFHPKLWNIFLYGEFTNTLPNTLQICSLKLTSPDDSDYPLKVYGDLTMCYRNVRWHQVIFSRDSDHCQTLTKEDPYLSLTGPYWPPLAPPKTEVYLEADLKLKGTTESDADKFLCLSAKCQEKDVVCNQNFSKYDLDIDPDDPYMRHVSSCCEKKPCECREFGKHYLLEMTRTIVTNSIFASISVQLFLKGPTDRLLSCFFTAYSDESSCEEDMKVVLLDCRDGKEEPVLVEKEKEEPVLENEMETEKEYTFELSRQSMCVDWKRGLFVYIEHGKTGKMLKFNPKLEGDDTQDVIIGPSGSRIQVKVTWSVYWDKSSRLLY